MYKPPFEITGRMLNICMFISECLGKLKHYQSLKKMPILRRNNRIRSIHSSLMIEDNSLSYDQVRDVISGKNVIGPKNEIKEVQNAFKAYDMISELDPFDEKDLLKTHDVLTNGLVEDSGRYRRHPEGVFDGSKLIFAAPPHDLVPKLMYDLFDWLKNDKEIPMLIKSCVFHYEFVFIHPFSDGNGRLVRLWQNVILTKWNPVFEFIPIETQIVKYQNDYYKAISDCNKLGNSNIFVEFMLKMIAITLDNLIENLENECSNISIQVSKLLDALEPDMPLSANDIMLRLNVKSKETLRNSYLNPAIENGLIKMTIPDKPNSKNQKYYK